MISLDRTIYRHVKRTYPPKELIEAYTPTSEERRFVNNMTRSQQHRLRNYLKRGVEEKISPEPSSGNEQSEERSA